MAFRETTGFVQNLLRLIDLDRAVPNLSTPGRSQNTPKVDILYGGSAGPLHLLIGTEPWNRNRSETHGKGDQGRRRR